MPEDDLDTGFRGKDTPDDDLDTDFRGKGTGNFPENFTSDIGDKHEISDDSGIGHEVCKQDTSQIILSKQEVQLNLWISDLLQKTPGISKNKLKLNPADIIKKYQMIFICVIISLTDDIHLCDYLLD